MNKFVTKKEVLITLSAMLLFGSSLLLSTAIAKPAHANQKVEPQVSVSYDEQADEVYMLSSVSLGD